MDRSKNDVCESFSPGYRKDDPKWENLILEVAGISEIFKALADETRTRILYLLSDSELCVCDLSDILDMTMPAVSHHLRLLKILRLVKYRREGKQVYYSLDDHHVARLIGTAIDHYSEEPG